MTSFDEPVLHALSVEPRCARAGELVRVVFRTRNLGAQPSPPGRVAFELGAGLEAPDGPGGLAVDVAPVEAGDYVRAEICARVAVPVDDGRRIDVRAALHVPGAVLATNACTLTARSRAVLDGPASGTFVEAFAAVAEAADAFAAAAQDRELVRVRAVVVNQGDGPAHAVRVIVPAPVGCVRADGDGPAVLDVDRFHPGARAELAFTARIVAPVATVRADGGEVRFGDGRRVALPSRSDVALAARLAAPNVVVTPSRRRADITIDVRNDGWADAHDVRVRIALPDGLRPLEGSTTADDAPVAARPLRRTTRGRSTAGNPNARAATPIAHTEREREAHTERGNDAQVVFGRDVHAIVVGLVPARSTVRVAMSALVPAPCAGGTVTVTVGEHRIDVPFVPDHVRDVRVHVLDSPPTACPGDVVRVVARIANAGDATETLSMRIEDAIPASASEKIPAARACTLVPGTAAVIELTSTVPDDAEDDALLERCVVVSGASGELACTGFALVVRNRVWLSLAEPPVTSDGNVRYTVRNGGATTAREATAIFAATTVPLGSIAPGERTCVEVAEHLARRGGMLLVAERAVLELPHGGERAPAVVHAALYAPEHVVAGASFTIRLQLDAEDDVDSLTVQVPAARGCRYVPGSTRLDGCALLDRAGSGPDRTPSPLDGDGLSLHTVPGGTRVSVSWSLIADASPPVGIPSHIDNDSDEETAYVAAIVGTDEISVGTVVGTNETTAAAINAETAIVRAVVRVDGDDRPVAPVNVNVRACEPFAARPAGLRYHVEGCALMPAEGLREPEIANPSGAYHPAALEAVGPVAGSHASVTDLVQDDDAAGAARGSGIVFGMRLDGERASEIERLLRGARGRGLAAHLFVLRLFFPDSVVVGNAAAPDALGVPAAADDADASNARVSEALAVVREAVRDVFDRLFVKSRIPGFVVCSDDLEDPGLRVALVTLLERLVAVAPERIAFAQTPSAFDRNMVQRMLAAIADAPFGAPAVLRALVALLPATCGDDPAVATVLRRHASLLDDALSRYDGLPLELFDDALANRGNIALDDARDGLLALVLANAPLAEAAC